ncbi:hypothetical protein ACFVX6_20390 [Streptomyces sp. NPDC058289]|uniref:hypothetical protein n=1 Tax=Streptomyces sp. NPDC058289 TaxID=3346425 RepID=UPI0036EFA7C9
MSRKPAAQMPKKGGSDCRRRAGRRVKTTEPRTVAALAAAVTAPMTPVESTSKPSSRKAISTGTV